MCVCVCVNTDDDYGDDGDDGGDGGDDGGADNDNDDDNDDFLSIDVHVAKHTHYVHSSYSVLPCLQFYVKNSPLQTLPQ